MPTLRSYAAAFCLLFAFLSASAETPVYPLFMEYDRPGLNVPHWSFDIQPDGQTEFKPTYASPQPNGADNAVVRFTMSTSGMQKLQKLLLDSKGMQPCETKTKGLARMGMKTLQYAGANGAPAKCSFNYTDNKPLAAAAEYLTAVSYTLEEGATIDRLHRYDRLGLDAVLIRLAAAAKEAKAPELASIRSSLQALVSDDQVLERVRIKASQLLALSDQQ